MPKFIIKWDIGYGPNVETVEADDQDQASRIAYERWREDCENNADYSAEPWTQGEADKFDIE